MIRKIIAVAVPALPLLTAASAFAALPAPAAPPAVDATEIAPPAAIPEAHGFDLLPSHRYQWAPSDAKNAQVGVDFGLIQLALGGFNVAAELRYRRFWFEYSHGVDLKLNNLGGLAMTSTERAENLRVFVPYTTGFGVGLTLVDELWLGVEFKTHRYEVNAPGGAAFTDAYLRYWPNVASSLDDGKIALRGADGTVSHAAHDWGVFANVSVGYAFDL